MTTVDRLLLGTHSQNIAGMAVVNGAMLQADQSTERQTSMNQIQRVISCFVIAFVFFRQRSCLFYLL